MADTDKPAAPPPAPKLIEADEFAKDANLPAAIFSIFARVYPGPLSRDGWLAALNQFTGRI